MLTIICYIDYFIWAFPVCLLVLIQLAFVLNLDLDLDPNILYCMFLILCPMVRNIAALANSFNDFSVVPSQFVPPIKSYCVSRK